MIYVLAYLVLAALIMAEHLVFAEKWRKQELARRTMGIATVLAVMFLLVVAGELDPQTWIVITGAFGLAGAITAWMYVTEQVERDARRREELRGQIDGETD